MKILHSFFVVLLLITNSVSIAQTDTAKLVHTIQMSADSMQTSFFKKDWNSFANLMHPQIFELTGGKEAFVKLVEQQMELLKDASVDSMKTGSVLQLLYYNGEWQCLVEAFMQMTVESMTLSSASTNIGVSKDGGATWKFIRVPDGNEMQMTKLIPGLSPQLKVPLNQQELTTLEEFLKIYKVKYSASKEN
jgi:hypothetical protein